MFSTKNLLTSTGNKCYDDEEDIIYRYTANVICNAGKCTGVLSLL